VTGATVTPGSVTSGTVTPGTVGLGIATPTVAGREIIVSGEGTVSVHSEGSKAVVLLGNHTLVVEKERLLLDGKERAKVPAAAAKIRVSSVKERLTVQADGKEVLATDLASRQ